MLRSFFISLLVSIMCIGSYHLYLVKKGVFSPRIKGIYTINLAQSLDTVKKETIAGVMSGKQDQGKKLEENLLKIQKAMNKIANMVPDGYIILPESAVLGGKRQMIDLLSGKIKFKKGVGIRLYEGKK